jgi:hypothetical protein
MSFLLPGSKLQCTAEDLYGARCGVLHTYTAESRLSDEGKARQVFYAWGIAKADDLQASAEITSFKGRAVTVHIDDLLSALRIGFQRFIQDAANDPARVQLIRSRAAKIFGHVSLELVAEAARIARGNHM